MTLFRTAVAAAAILLSACQSSETNTAANSSEAGQEAQIFDFASHVDADQRMEIHRMRGMFANRLP